MIQNYNSEGTTTFYIWVHDSFPAEIPFGTEITVTLSCGEDSSDYSDPDTVNYNFVLENDEGTGPTLLTFL